ncbi:unnamed protein product [Dicrocoelium dendriticum]|nr:unnamed protein product [Dicrocoelium dendriticum]
MIPEAIVVPTWFNHASHSAGICLTAFDGLLWKPASAPLGPSATTLIALALGYNVYLEYLAQVKHFYAYPLLSNVSHKGRYLIYGATWILVLACFIVAVYYCKYLVSLSDARRTKSRGFVSDQSLRNTTEENPRKIMKAD